MKMTLVLDTDDPQGLDDALTIARILVAKHSKSQYPSKKAVFAKIPLIKFVREYGRVCEDHMTNCERKGVSPTFSGLKECKQFVDSYWNSLKEA